jgi:hypothetical protein
VLHCGACVSSFLTWPRARRKIAVTLPFDFHHARQCGTDQGTFLDFERRGGPRYHFSATAEVRGLSSPARIGRVKDLSRGGCYVAIREPFSEGFEVTVRITTETESFQCHAVVARATHGIGMGITFGALEAGSQRVLEAWLAAAQCRSDAP